MKRPKRHVLLYLLPLAVLAAASSTQSVAASEQRRAGLDALRTQAWREGSIGIIVRMDVPGIRELTAAAAAFGRKAASPAIAEDRTSADEALKNAIECAAWRIRADLTGTAYAVNAVYRSLPFIALRVSPNALSVLETSPAVLGIEEDVPLKLINPVKGSNGAKGGSSKIPGADINPLTLEETTTLIGAKSAWKRGFTGAGWYVAVLDTGIRKTHEFFSEKDIVEACFALGRDGLGGAGDCPNGSAAMTGPGAAEHYPSTYPSYDHGTHVAGIAAGNYGSLAGVAKGADIIVVQVFSKFTAGDCGGSSPCLLSWTSDILAGLNHVYSLRGNYDIAAVNVSIGGGKYYSPCDSDATKSAIDLLRAAGIATVIAAGNDAACNFVTSPACVSTAVAVGSSTIDDDESAFNNWHATMLKLFAPGTSVYSSTGASDSSYATWSGTSMAAPHVTGAWALLKQAFPGGRVDELLDALETKGKPITSVCDGNQTPIPRIQVDDAITWLAPSYALTIQAEGPGTTSPVPGRYDYDAGAQVQVTALPDANAEFINWTGDVASTDNPVTVTMNGHKTMKANFRWKPKLTIQSDPNGTTNPPPGEYYYSAWSEVEIRAIPNANCEFVEWTGDISTSDNPVTITMYDAARTIKANFRRKPKLTIRSAPNGRTNPAAGEYIYSTGTEVGVEAIPNVNCEFVGWSGDISGAKNPVTLVMNANATIAPVFRVKPKLTIQSSPYGTTGPAPGEYYYSTGAQAVISAVAEDYAYFTGWTGSATGSDNPLSLTMTENKTILANFRYVFPPAASGRQVANRTFSQVEYINVLTWEPDPANDGLDVAFYRIYLVNDDDRSLLVELGADQREYYHRKAGQAVRQYAITAVLGDGREGAPALVTIQ